MFDYNRYRTRIVDNFDRYGMIIGHIEYDTTGLNIRYRSELKYDSTDKLVNETGYNYSHFDSVKCISVLSETPDTIQIQIKYDSLNRIIKKTFINSSGRKYYEIVFGFSPMMETERSFNRDSSLFEIVMYYDVLYVENRSSATFSDATGQKTRSWDYTFKNFFDRSGKIKRRKVQGEFYPEKPDKPDIYFQEMDYQYMSTGLLIKRLSSDCNDNSLKLFAMVFDYKFW